MTELALATLRAISGRVPRSFPAAPLVLIRPSFGGLRRLAMMAGPGWMIAVGYMDPGNWATDIAAGSAFGYRLLFVVALAGLAGMLFQALSARLGFVTGCDLAAVSRKQFPPLVSRTLWLLSEIGIVACDIAEIVGTAIALKLLFHLPLLLGIVTSLGFTVAMLTVERGGLRLLEGMIALLVLAVVACLLLEVAWARPDWVNISSGLVPDIGVLGEPGALVLAIGIIGATVMPHNLYLHGALIARHLQEQRRRPGEADPLASQASILRSVTMDSHLALTGAFVVNAAILILAAAAFHTTGRSSVAGLADAQALLIPILGPASGVVFAVALLIAGQNSTVTATMAGQVIMEGFTDLRLPPAMRRLLTRSLAIVPAAIITAISGERGADSLLILSQVVLCLQLPFAVVPLVMFTRDRRLMGDLAAPAWMTMMGAGCALLLIAANAVMLCAAIA